MKRLLLRSRYLIQIYVGAVDTIPCFLRVHAQIYLDLSDYQRLAYAVLEILSSGDVDGVEAQRALRSDPMMPIARSAPAEQ